MLLASDELTLSASRWAFPAAWVTWPSWFDEAWIFCSRAWSRSRYSALGNVNAKHCCMSLEIKKNINKIQELDSPLCFAVIDAARSNTLVSSRMKKSSRHVLEILNHFGCVSKKRSIGKYVENSDLLHSLFFKGRSQNTFHKSTLIIAFHAQLTTSYNNRKLSLKCVWTFQCTKDYYFSFW